MTSFIAFIIAATLLTLTPGVDTAMVLRASLGSHRRVAFCAASGVVLGCLAWGGAVSLGLGIVLQASEWLYLAVKLAGAAYLIWLGLGLLLQPRKKIDSDGSHPGLQPWVAFRQGLVTNLLNPKIGIFYVSFLPQFIPSEMSVSLYSFFLASVHAVLTLLWFTLLILIASRISRWMQSPRVISRFDRITGGLFIGFGARLALSQG
ncbi:LysE family translocator [Marinobacterium stanieri]|uniref:Threonine/homoserine/homoserine lactone efflux protein n=1 Tax=Marinobacterium stanieri TaxID=49186 RepID=A0A1N6UQH7_9GAMM|nr:LysE family translocator [Marinobacterium stanieri]SIQ67903.1 Threonine/homoserine/homoserine lactone efflux protein [Marinobacterium stanieri]